jgi:hypothetical protein
MKLGTLARVFAAYVVACYLMIALVVFISSLRDGPPSGSAWIPLALIFAVAPVAVPFYSLYWIVPLLAILPTDPLLLFREPEGLTVPGIFFLLWLGLYLLAPRQVVLPWRHAA